MDINTLKQSARRFLDKSRVYLQHIGSLVQSSYQKALPTLKSINKKIQPLLCKIAIFFTQVFKKLWLYFWGAKAVEISFPTEMPEPKILNNVSIALVLSGGAARGAAHAGVISVLQEHNIPIDLVVGTSIGSVIGAIYCDNPQATDWSENLKSIRRSSLFDPSLRSLVTMLFKLCGISNGHALQGFLKKYVQSETMSELKIPLAVVTCDINRSELFVIQSGPVIPAVQASCAIPVMYSPVHLYGRLLVDAGVMNPLSADVAKQLGAKKIIVVDLNTTQIQKEVTSNTELCQQRFWATMRSLSSPQHALADVLITPTFESTVIFDDKQSEVFFEAGRKAAIEALSDIKKLL